MERRLAAILSADVKSYSRLMGEDEMEFRIGINLGDVLVEGERLYGDGVNIAAWLESLAEAGGICISGTVYEQIATKLALGMRIWTSKR